MPCVFLEGVPEFEVRHGLMFVTSQTRSGPQTVCTTVRDFRLGMALANEVLAKWQYDQLGARDPPPAIPFRRKDAKAEH